MYHTMKEPDDHCFNMKVNMLIQLWIYLFISLFLITYLILIVTVNVKKGKRNL